ncbi:Uncharacterized protein YuzB, UPF0349 family [Geosporobacter subterraneus DSM 17957]|uniref:Uncharacterized protein YuzB, UPF0349 family n=1 Tax=Geosporobacter subterraneus DSM 17957 TaxID=1121919 RepID=A0A1M6LEE8_9FIRM|nr:DUF1450 domain-containing protein [Geosporobacter subterraneus]SHJ69579.1 Uncharacterized protein YuzB, UPF0349 family [Geosporobacter subterraneus DSM 17957]
MTKIKVCQNNYGYDTNEVIEKIKDERPEIEIEVAACWGYCDDCASGPYVFVDDEMVQADSPEDLYESILETL